MTPPSEAVLAEAERALRALPPRSQRAVGGGVYMRLDGDGRRRFQFRARGGGSHGAGTFDTWEEAAAAREERANADCDTERRIAAQRTSLRKGTVRSYAPIWWQTVVTDLEILTQLDYEYGLKIALEVAGDVTMEELEQDPFIVDEIKARLKKLKTHPPRRRNGSGDHLPTVFHKAAADKGLKVLSSIASHAVERNVISRNPLLGVRRFNYERGPNGRKASGHRAIKRSEVIQPRIVARAGLGFRGSVAEIEADRLIPELIAWEGLRPQHVCAMRHRWWRDENGPRTHILLDEAVKDVKGHLILGEAKTGPHEPVLWPAIAEQLERVWQAQGCPDLDSLVCPNAKGEFFDWGNWRRDWYKALHRAGISQGVLPSSPGAFEPYLCRHIGAVTMTHAQRPESVGGGVYSRYEVARHLGHTVQTLDKVYADVPDDLLGIAGKTMDEIIRDARREEWGPVAGDPDYELRRYTTAEASELTGLSVNRICGRIERGTLPATRVGGRYQVSDHHLVVLGLLPPRHRR